MTAPPDYNPGPSITKTHNTQAVLGSPGYISLTGVSGLFNNPLSVTLSGTVDNWNPTGWGPGTINFLMITPTGSPTINGISTQPMTPPPPTFGMTTGYVFLVYNTSTTATIAFANLASTSLTANQIACPGATTAYLGPQTAALMTFNGTNLIFAG